MLNLRSACTKVPMLRNTCKISYPEIVMDARGNKISSCKIPNLYLKKNKKKLLNF